MSRTLSLLFPDGKTEFWFTDRVFQVGDKLSRKGKTWTVTSLGDFNRDGKALAVTLSLERKLQPQPEYTSSA